MLNIGNHFFIEDNKHQTLLTLLFLKIKSNSDIDNVDLRAMRHINIIDLSYNRIDQVSQPCKTTNEQGKYCNLFFNLKN